MLVNFTGLPELQHLPCRATMALNKTFPLNVVLVMNLEQNNPQCAQSVVRRLREAGHHITLFGKEVNILLTLMYFCVLFSYFLRTRFYRSVLNPASLLAVVSLSSS